MFVFAKQPQSIGGLIKDTFRFYKTSICRIFLLVLVMSALMHGLILVIQNGYIYAPKWLLVTAGIVIFMLVSVYFSCVILRKMYAIGRGEREKLISILPAVVPQFLKVFASLIIFILFFICLLVLLAILSGILTIPSGLVAYFSGLSSFLVGKAVGHAFTTVFILSAFLLFYFFAIVLAFYLPLILFDNVGPVAVIKRSVRFVWGSWWRTFLILFIISLITMLIAGITFIPAYAVLYPLDIPPHVYFIAMTIISALTWPLSFTAVLVIYNDLKLRQK